MAPTTVSPSTPFAQPGHALRAVLYGRVSTTNHGQDVEVQLRHLRAYCQARGLTITHEIRRCWHFWCQGVPSSAE